MYQWIAFIRVYKFLRLFFIDITYTRTPKNINNEMEFQNTRNGKTSKWNINDISFITHITVLMLHTLIAT